MIKLTRKKTKKFRGSRTHGRGKKGGRGAGLRGGRGNAGLLKHRYMYMIKNMPDHFGKHGFKRHQSIAKREKTINVGQLEEKFEGKKDINLTKEGYDKLLGTGNIKTTLKIQVKSASQKAIHKISEKRGEVKTEIKAEPEHAQIEEDTTESEETEVVKVKKTTEPEEPLEAKSEEIKTEKPEIKETIEQQEKK